MQILSRWPVNQMKQELPGDQDDFYIPKTASEKLAALNSVRDKLVKMSNELFLALTITSMTFKHQRENPTTKDNDAKTTAWICMEFGTKVVYNWDYNIG